MQYQFSKKSLPRESVRVRVRVRSGPNVVGRLELGPLVVGRLWSGVWVSVSFKIFALTARGKWLGRGNCPGGGMCTRGECPWEMCYSWFLWQVQEVSINDGSYTSVMSPPTLPPPPAAAAAGGGCHYWTLAPSPFAGSHAASAPPSAVTGAQFCPAPLYYQVIYATRFYRAMPA